jgi:pimeloyl-ACP methyl ester carboxylesterase
VKVILLPGLDGTGLLFKPLLEQTPSSDRFSIFSLIQEPIGYQPQIELLEKEIGDAEVILVAESYSGYIAYELACQGNIGIKHIVFVASFLVPPSFLMKFLGNIPLGLIKSQLLPYGILNYFLFGNKGNRELEKSFYTSINSVSNRVLIRRLKNISELKLPTKTLKIPCTYIKAKSDRLVNANSVKMFEKVCTNLTIKLVDGGHFVLQSNPKTCLGIINRAIAL